MRKVYQGKKREVKERGLDTPLDKTELGKSSVGKG
jgi:hypothetical protein